MQPPVMRRLVESAAELEIEMDEEIEAALMHAGAQIEALQRENAALRKDAERYRYLRDRVPAEVLGQVKSAAGCWIDCEDEEGTLVLLTGNDADAAVDAAMLAARAVG